MKNKNISLVGSSFSGSVVLGLCDIFPDIKRGLLRQPSALCPDCILFQKIILT